MPSPANPPTKRPADPAAAGLDRARTLPVRLGRAAAVVSGTAGSSDPDVSVQGQHGMSRTGSVRIALGMGSASAGVEELGVYHPRRARQKPRGSVGGSE